MARAPNDHRQASGPKWIIHLPTSLNIFNPWESCLLYIFPLIISPRQRDLGLSSAYPLPYSNHVIVSGPGVPRRQVHHRIPWGHRGHAIERLLLAPIRRVPLLTTFGCLTLAITAGCPGTVDISDPRLAMEHGPWTVIPCY